MNATATLDKPAMPEPPSEAAVQCSALLAAVRECNQKALMLCVSVANNDQDYKNAKEAEHLLWQAKCALLRMIVGG